jgi:hypothetical protein
MTSVTHEPVRREQLSWWQFFGPDFWPSLAIMVIWLAVLLDAVFGPDLVSNTVAGDHTTVPSAILLSAPAFFATWVVAKYGFRRNRDA